MKDGLTPDNFPKIDVKQFDFANSYSANMAQQISRDMEETNRRVQKNAEDIYERQEAVRKAAIQTAQNTEEMKGDLQKVVHNQNNYIALLEENVTNQKIQIDNQETQLKMQAETLSVLKGILDFSNLSVDVQNEIADIIRDEITNKHPVLDFAVDKGGDVATAGIVAILPHVFNAVKLYLMSKGITF